MFTICRADKTEVLNHEELQVAEHKVEYIKNAVTAVSKRIPSVSNEKVEAVEKRMVIIFFADSDHCNKWIII